MNLGNLMISNDIFPTKDDSPISLASSNDLEQYLKIDDFSIQLSSNSSKTVISSVVKDSKLSCLYSDSNNMVCRHDLSSNVLNRCETDNFQPASITTLGNGAALVANGKYKFFAGKMSATGLYGSADGITWEQITLPTIGDVNLNNKNIVRIAYINEKYVIIAKDGTYYYTSELSDDATKWCEAGIELKGYNNAAYINLSEDNAILKLDDNNFIVYRSTSIGGCCLVTNFTTITPIVGMGNNIVHSFTKIDNTHYICTTGSGVWFGSSLTGTFTKKSITTSDTNTWQWLNTYYDEKQNMLFVCGDGGDYKNSDAGRKTDIWYSTDKGETTPFTHATFVDREASELNAVGRIYSCKDVDGNSILVALAMKNTTIRIFTSYDGINWSTNNSMIYTSSGTMNWLKNSVLVQKDDADFIMYWDGAKLASYQFNGYFQHELAITENCVSYDSFGLTLSAKSNAKPLNELLNTNFTIDESVVKTYTPEKTTADNQYSKNIYGARAYLSVFFNDIMPTTYPFFTIKDITFKPHVTIAANQVSLKITDPDGNVLGISEPNVAAESSKDCKFTFSSDVLVDSTLQFIKILFVDPSSKDIVSIVSGIKCSTYSGSTDYGVYTNSSAADVDAKSLPYNTIYGITYVGTKTTTCAKNILELGDSTRTSLTVDGKVFTPVLFTGTYTDSTEFSFYMLSATNS